jgi:Co/Zn/Cd efflux system component
MLTDVAALSLSLAAAWFSSRRATPRKTYGFYRVEILAALLNGVFLVLISLYIFYEAMYGTLIFSLFSESIINLFYFFNHLFSAR